MVSKLNIGQFSELANYLKQVKPKVSNFLVFNPGHEWRETVDVTFGGRYSDYQKPIHQAIDILEPEVTVNVRFYPLCFMKGYEKNNSNFPQQGYDPYEWSFYQKRETCEDEIRDLYIRGKKMNIYHEEEEEIPYNALALKQGYEQCLKSEKCFACSCRNICSGFPYNYIKRFGFGEEKPFTGGLVKDPLCFRRQDAKNRIYDSESEKY